MEAEIEGSATPDHAGELPTLDLPELSSDDGVPLEDKLVSLMKEGKAQEGQDPNAVRSGEDKKTIAGPRGKEPATQAQPIFDLNGKFSLKAGEKLSPEHIKELERGWLRESDYTRKTQELARERQEYQQTRQALDMINKDPRYLRQYIPDRQILSAYQPQELLNIGLAGSGIPVPLWNQFLDWHAQNGGDFGQQADQFRADPYQEKFSQYDQKVRTLEQQLQGFQSQRAEETREAQMSRVDQEVDTTLTQYPGLTKKELLVKMATDNTPDKTIGQMAKEVADEKESRFQEWFKNKETQQKKRVTAPTGTSVPIMPHAPKTWKEADDMTEQLYGARP